MASLVVVLWVLSGLFITRLYRGLPDSPGTFGDMFGAVNSLFSGLAFAGLIYTILQQREELDLTRQEFIKQNETFRLQRFENTFFQLLRLNDDLLDGHTITGNQESVETRVYLHDIAERVTKMVSERLERFSGNSASSREARIALLAQAIDPYKKEIETSLLHYFNNLFSIVQLVDASPLIGQSDKSLYINILRTQMSVSEKNLLLLLLIVREDMRPQKPLYDRYHFLKNYSEWVFGGALADTYRHL